MGSLYVGEYDGHRNGPNILWPDALPNCILYALIKLCIASIRLRFKCIMF